LNRSVLHLQEVQTGGRSRDLEIQVAQMLGAAEHRSERIR
jgi:hypothetical protein